MPAPRHAPSRKLVQGKATGGQILTSQSTVERVKDRFAFEPLGAFPLKNLSEEVEIFALKD